VRGGGLGFKSPEKFLFAPVRPHTHTSLPAVHSQTFFASECLHRYADACHPFPSRAIVCFLCVCLSVCLSVCLPASARERILGFYSTGPKIRPADFALEHQFRAYCPHPVLVIVDVRPECEEIPTQAYVAVETVAEV
jgi:hypothetical protein